MSIAMEPFGINEQKSEFRVASGWASPTFPYRTQCHACGFEPTDVFAPPPCCPKCGRSAWERFISPRSLLMNANRSKNDALVKRASHAIVGTV
jgi:hypothetical protein